MITMRETHIFFSMHVAVCVCVRVFLDGYKRYRVHFTATGSAVCIATAAYHTIQLVVFALAV